MNDLDRSVLATLAYYGAFGWPLTLVEIVERLIPARRLGGRDDEVSMGIVLERLDRLIVMEMVAREHSFYILKGVEEGFGDRRIEQEKIWAQKWRRMLHKAWWLQVVPYVRGIYASGSLAAGNMSAQSDWDIFIIARSRRLYTARMGLLLTARVLGALRTKHDAIASDKFCFNHYITTDGLNISHRSLYTAHGLSVLVPIMDRSDYLQKLWHANQWIGQYRPMPISEKYTRRSVRSSRLLRAIAQIIEIISDTTIGDLMERRLMCWQQKRIKQEPATYQQGGRVIATDREIEFHPRSFETIALERYNSALDRMGFGMHREQDSGLTK